MERVGRAQHPWLEVARVLIDVGHLDAAARLCDRVRAGFVRAGLGSGAARAALVRGLARYQAGRLAEAAADLEVAARGLTGPGDEAAAAEAALFRALVAEVRGERDAGARLRAAEAAAEATGDAWLLAHAWAALGRERTRRGQVAAARARLEAAHGMFERLGDRDGLAVVALAMSDAAAAAGEHDAARRHARGALRLYAERGDGRGVAWCLRRLDDRASRDGGSDGLCAAAEVRYDEPGSWPASGEATEMR